MGRKKQTKATKTNLEQPCQNRPSGRSSRKHSDLAQKRTLELMPYPVPKRSTEPTPLLKSSSTALGKTNNGAGCFSAKETPKMNELCTKKEVNEVVAELSNFSSTQLSTRRFVFKRKDPVGVNEEKVVVCNNLLNIYVFQLSYNRLTNVFL